MSLVEERWQQGTDYSSVVGFQQGRSVYAQ